MAVCPHLGAGGIDACISIDFEGSEPYSSSDSTTVERSDCVPLAVSSVVLGTDGAPNEVGVDASVGVVTAEVTVEETAEPLTAVG